MHLLNINDLHLLCRSLASRPWSIFLKLLSLAYVRYLSTVPVWSEQVSYGGIRTFAQRTVDQRTVDQGRLVKGRLVKRTVRLWTVGQISL